MRVIAGSLKGRRLKSVRGAQVRPTADRVREGLFSMLMSRFDLSGTVVLDLFAGTGALGIEALSRGAARTVFVEQGRDALRVLRSNVEMCGISSCVEIWPLSVRRALRELQGRDYRFDGMLLDPPYGSGLLGSTMELLSASGMLRPGGWVVAEGHVDDTLPEAYGKLRLTRNRRYGKTVIVLYSLANIEITGTGS